MLIVHTKVASESAIEHWKDVRRVGVSCVGLRGIGCTIIVCRIVCGVRCCVACWILFRRVVANRTTQRPIQHSLNDLSLSITLQLPVHNLRLYPFLRSESLPMIPKIFPRYITRIHDICHGRRFTHYNFPCWNSSIYQLLHRRPWKKPRCP